MPSFKQVYLEDFATRDDLLDAALASAHIPFLLNWRPTAMAGGRRYVDGSFRDFIEWRNSDLLTCNGAAFVVTLLATYIPARCAARVNPVEALRYE